MRTNRSFAIVARWGSIPLLLLTVLLQACSSSWNPLDPVDPPDVQQPPAAPQPPVVPQPPSVPDPPAEQVPAGVLEVSVDASDAALTLGYMVLVYFDGIPAPRGVRGTGALTRIENLPQGSHSVALQSLVGNCTAEDPRPRPFSIVGGETTRIGFNVSCAAVFGFAEGVYERTSYYATSVKFHGTIAERYVIEDDGSFGLRFESGRYGSFEYPGALYLVGSGAEGTRLGLVFAANNGQWTATATLRGKCLVVEYNTDMMLSDFAPGEYCRL